LVRAESKGNDEEKADRSVKVKERKQTRTALGNQKKKDIVYGGKGPGDRKKTWEKKHDPHAQPAKTNSYFQACKRRGCTSVKGTRGGKGKEHENAPCGESFRKKADSKNFIRREKKWGWGKGEGRPSVVKTNKN